jgi:hypothetical protein
MFTPVTQYRSVRKFLAQSGALYLSTDTALLLIAGGQETIISDKPVYTFRHFEDQILFQHENGKDLQIYDVKKDALRSIAGRFYLWSAYADQHGLFIEGDDEQGQNAVFILQEGRLDRSPLEDAPVLIHYDTVFIRVGGLSAKDLHTGSKLWKKSFEKPLKIEGNLYGGGNNLLVPLNDSRLLALDVKSGDQHWELADCLPYYARYPKTGYLYGYGGETYEVIDPVNGVKLIEKRFSEEHNALKVLPAPHEHFIYENRMYFTSNTYGSKFGAIDLDRHSIDFVQPLDVAEGVTAYLPQREGNRLYILDTEEVLHVFEA